LEREQELQEEVVVELLRNPSDPEQANAETSFFTGPEQFSQTTVAAWSAERISFSN